MQRLDAAAAHSFVGRELSRFLMHVGSLRRRDEDSGGKGGGHLPLDEDHLFPSTDEGDGSVDDLEKVQAAWEPMLRSWVDQCMAEEARLAQNFLSFSDSESARSKMSRSVLPLLIGDSFICRNILLR